MGRKIQVLSKEVANRIAAGEVVLNPASVVKELVENAVDAGSSKVAVTLKDGGGSSIRVVDDGVGILREDLPYAFMRNATSKMEKLEELSSVETLGFRGEALFSIGCVSHVEVVTRTEGESVGAKIRVEDNQVLEVEDAVCNRGTSITVDDLFYNTPARKKHLKSKRQEGYQCISIVEKLAVAHPEVGFQLFQDGKEVFTTLGDGKIRNCVSAVMGVEFLRRMIPIDFEDEPLKIEGYLLSPNYLNKHNEESVLIINGRYVKSDVIHRGINQVYREEYGNFHRALGYVLYITLPFGMLDVNIHPAKTTVSFRNETLIVMLLCQAVRQALRGGIQLNEHAGKSGGKKGEKGVQLVSEGMVGYMAEEMENGEVVQAVRPAAELGESVKHTGVEAARDLLQRQGENDQGWEDGSAAVEWKRQGEGVERKMPGDTEYGDGVVDRHQDVEDNGFVGGRKGCFWGDKGNRPEKIAVKPHGCEADSSEMKEVAHSSAKRNELTGIKQGKGIMAEQMDVDPRKDTVDVSIFDRLLNMEYVGLAFNAYALFASGNELYSIDTHACHERVLYDRYVKQFKRSDVDVQILAVPFVAELPGKLYFAALENLEAFKAIGFDVEDFADRELIVRAIPSHFAMNQVKEVLVEMLEHIRDFGYAKGREREERLIKIACHSAVRGRDKVTYPEIRRLLEDLKRTDNPFTCPHGRPTVGRIRKKYFEKMFERVK